MTELYFHDSIALLGGETFLSISVGKVTQEIMNLLSLQIPLQKTEIFFGVSNRQHIQTQHPDIISRYGTTMSGVGQNITLILADPTYVGYHNASIEYMKTMSTGETLKVAVRASKNGTLFVRSIYLISPEDIQRFLQHGRLKALTKQSFCSII